MKEGVPSKSHDDVSSSSSSSSSLDRRRTHDVIGIMKIFIDAMTIYRSTLVVPIDRTITTNDTNDSIDSANNRIIKIRDDSLYVSDIIEALMEEIETKGTCSVLIREIEDNEKRRTNEAIVAENYAKSQTKIFQLRKLVVTEKKSNAKDREVPKAQLVRRKNDNEILELTMNLESRYVTKCEKARCESTFCRCGMDLKNRRDEFGNIVLREKNECRVATEIEAFLEQNATANEMAASQWQLRYDREIKMYADENERLTLDMKNRRQLLEKLRQEYQERQDFIDSYSMEKAIMLEREKRDIYRRDCSIVIQSWWRGVMVRRKLGPYRPDEKKKKRAVKSKK